MRCLIGGSLIDDIDYYNRVHEMMHVLTSNNNRENNDVEGFGYRWDSRSDYGGWSTARVGGIPSNNTASPYNEMNVCFKPRCGLLGQSKYIPLMWCPLTFEFENG